LVRENRFALLGRRLPLVRLGGGGCGGAGVSRKVEGQQLIIKLRVEHDGNLQNKHGKL
jgi:hypothetical protein